MRKMIHYIALPNYDVRMTQVIRLFLVSTTFLAIHPAIAQERFGGFIDDYRCIVLKDQSERYVKDLKSGKDSRMPDDFVRADSDHMGSQLTLPNGDLLSVMKGDLYLLGSDGSERQLTTDPEIVEQNPTLNDDRSKVAYTKQGNLYVWDFKQSREIKLTQDGNDKIYNGWSSWVYYEEILRRASKYKAFWWSPDNKHIAFLRFDDNPVPVFPIYRLGDDAHGYLEERHYPKVGDPNPDVKLGLVDTDQKVIQWVKEDSTKDQYTAWPFWSPDGSKLVYQEVNRLQDSLTLKVVDIAQPDSPRTLLVESSTTWIKFHEDLRFLDDQHVVFVTQDGSWQNLISFDIRTGENKFISQHNSNVLNIIGTDGQTGRIFYYIAGDSGGEHQLAVSNYDGSGQMILTPEPGWHSVQFSANYSYFHSTYTTIDNPYSSYIASITGEKVYTFSEFSTDRNEQSGVRILTFTVEVDSFALPLMCILPKGFRPDVKYPVVFTVYGGPERLEVPNRYRNFSNDYYSNNGIIRVFMDHRGSGRFGKQGTDYLFRALGKWEMNDLVEGVKYLKTLEYVDPDRIGITGGSYGGYLTCLALTLGSDHFTHGISLYPVTDWRFYDNVYTERYMDTPVENESGYNEGSAIFNAYRYKGKMLLVHGSADDNVHMQNSMKLISKLQDLGKDFQMMIYPGERHGVGGAKYSHLNSLIFKFWDQELKPKRTLVGP